MLNCLGSGGMTGSRDVVVVIATYNEAKTIGALLDAIRYPVIVVDDNSPDGTWLIAIRHGATVITRAGKQGIASAYRLGFARALQLRPKFIVQMDAGFTHDPADIERMVSLAAGADLVIGSRFAAARWIKS